MHDSGVVNVAMSSCRDADLTGKDQRGQRVASMRNGPTACRSDQRLSGSDVRPLIVGDSLNGLFGACFGRIG